MHMNKKITAISLGFMCFILTVGICIQLKTVESSNINPTQTISENRLRDEILKWRERYEQVAKQVNEKEKELDNQRKKATENDESSKEIQDELENLQRMLGYTDLNGKGVIVTLDDNKSIATEDMLNPNDFIIHDEDLMLIVNDLRAGGAEAISINGQRVVSTTEITCIGPTIMINGQKIAAPYEIKAIGYPASLIGTINFTNSYAELLRSYGLTVDIEEKENITIYKYSGVIRSTYMTIAQ